MRRGWLAVCLVLLSAAAAAQARAPALDLDVKPVLCIIDRATPACDLRFLVLWKSDATGDYCLFNDFDSTPLACWRDERAGEHTDRRAVSEGFRYWMTPEGDDRVLAAVTIEVLRLDSEDRRRARRSRHVWDVL